MPIIALYLINNNIQYYRYTYMIYNIYIIRITNWLNGYGKCEVMGKYAMGGWGAKELWGFGGNGEWEFVGQWGLWGRRAVDNRRLKGNGECESWKQWVLGGVRINVITYECEGLGQCEDKKIPNPKPN